MLRWLVLFSWLLLLPVLTLDRHFVGLLVVEVAAVIVQMIHTVYLRLDAHSRQIVGQIVDNPVRSAAYMAITCRFWTTIHMRWGCWWGWCCAVATDRCVDRWWGRDLDRKMERETNLVQSFRFSSFVYFFCQNLITEFRRQFYQLYLSPTASSHINPTFNQVQTKIPAQHSRKVSKFRQKQKHWNHETTKLTCVIVVEDEVWFVWLLLVRIVVLLDVVLLLVLLALTPLLFAVGLWTSDLKNISLFDCN